MSFKKSLTLTFVLYSSIDQQDNFQQQENINSILFSSLFMISSTVGSYKRAKINIYIHKNQIYFLYFINCPRKHCLGVKDYTLYFCEPYSNFGQLIRSHANSKMFLWHLGKISNGSHSKVWWKLFNSTHVRKTQKEYNRQKHMAT